MINCVFYIYLILMYYIHTEYYIVLYYLIVVKSIILQLPSNYNMSSRFNAFTVLLYSLFHVYLFHCDNDSGININAIIIQF